MNADLAAVIENVRFDEKGLVTVVAQDHESGEVLMVAWMNAEALERTIRDGYATYWSRSRRSLWRKGETSGNLQAVKGLWLDCDGDTVLLKVEQHGGISCHTGRRSCFYREKSADGWREFLPVITDPAEIYGNGDP